MDTINELLDSENKSWSEAGIDKIRTLDLDNVEEPVYLENKSTSSKNRII